MTDPNHATPAGATAAPRGEHEARYMADVEQRLGAVAPERRRELLAVVVENLDERPTATSWVELVQALGAPAEYAEELLGKPARPTHPSVPSPQDRLRRRRRWLAIAAALVVVIAGAIALLPIRERRQPDPEFFNSCWGANSDDSGFDLTSVEAAGITEYKLVHAEGVEFTIPVCLSSDREVEVLDIRLFPEGDELTLFPFSQIAIRSRRSTGDTPPPPTPDQPVTLVPNTGIAVDLLMRFNPCLPSKGNTRGATNFTVSYRHDGEDRTAQVDLGAWYSVADVGSCTVGR